MEISKQEIEYARELAAIRRAKRGIGVSKDTGKSRYAQNGGNPVAGNETVEGEEDKAAAALRFAKEEAKRRLLKKTVEVAAKSLIKVALPYILPVLAVVVGVILLIMLVIVIVQSPTATTEDEYETYTTEEGVERKVHMPQFSH